MSAEGTNNPHRFYEQYRAVFRHKSPIGKYLPRKQHLEIAYYLILVYPCALIFGEVSDKSVWNRFGRLAKQGGAKHRATGCGESVADKNAFK